MVYTVIDISGYLIHTFSDFSKGNKIRNYTYKLKEYHARLMYITNLSVSPVPLMMMILRQPSESPYMIRHSSYPVELKDVYTKTVMIEISLACHILLD